VQSLDKFKNKKSESGATMVESVIMLSVLVLTLVISVNVLFYVRYAGAAQWLATVAARVGAVAEPSDTPGPAPISTDLKLPQASGIPYLMHYEQATASFGCGGAQLTERHRRTLNLVLGEFERVFKTDARTVSTWTSTITVGTPPMPGEFYIVPVNCTNTAANLQFTQWRVCTMVPQIFTNTLVSCHNSSSTVHGI